jgi:hypothetical protein
MTETKPTPPPPQYAVWFFVAATFVFVMPVTLFRGSAELWVTIVSVSVGMLLCLASRQKHALG